MALAIRAYMRGYLKFTAEERTHAGWWLRESIVLTEIENESRVQLEEVLVKILSDILVVTPAEKRSKRADRVNELYADIVSMLEPFRDIMTKSPADMASSLVEKWKQQFGDTPEDQACRRTVNESPNLASRR